VLLPGGFCRGSFLFHLLDGRDYEEGAPALRGEVMKRLILALSVFAATTLTLADANKKEIFAFPSAQVRWFTPSYYTDGRERAQLFGDSSQGGAWVDRVKIPAGRRVLALTHPQDEMVTVIEGA